MVGKLESKPQLNSKMRLKLYLKLKLELSLANIKSDFKQGNFSGKIQSLSKLITLVLSHNFYANLVMDHISFVVLFGSSLEGDRQTLGN